AMHGPAGATGARTERPEPYRIRQASAVTMTFAVLSRERNRTRRYESAATSIPATTFFVFPA
ncbi:hypothetical protein, partial [Paraburkholderia caribensis]|uniref:hypothetical protein n=1 Tax=Paraburkholderia caribensis TaxID=75105 RepID=UPI001C62B6A5